MIPSDNWRIQDSDKYNLLLRQKLEYDKVHKYGRDWNLSQKENLKFKELRESNLSAEELLWG